MSDLMNEVNSLRFYYTEPAAAYDKDALKNEAHQLYSQRVSALMVIPFGF